MEMPRLQGNVVEMKAILEFSLPEDREEFNLAQKGAMYKALLDDTRSILRNYRKYHDLKPEAAKLIEEIETEFNEITEGIWD